MKDMQHNMQHNMHGGHNGAVQDLVGGGSVTLKHAIASQTSDTHGAAHDAHHGDSGLMKDHSSLLDLFPDASDPKVAVALNGGSWFDPGTWSTGKVPQDGQSVYIPKGVSVVYDDVSNNRLDKVAVDGELHFAVAKDTKMMVDTLMTGPKSVLTIGTEDNPVKSNVSAEIIIHRDNGPINVAEDPTQLSKGVVTHGVVRIAGQDKDDHLKASDAPEKGDNFLIFDERPDGWQVGDKLVVAGTKLISANEFQDEVVTIKSISKLGNGDYKVNLDQTLKYDHTPPDNSAGVEFKIPVANYTRNVTISTEIKPSDYMDDGKTVPIDERGHVMFMHNPDVDVQNAEFLELGRTDKSKVLHDEDNVAGRYALHFHRTGGEAGEKPAHAEGNAIWGSPGWGLVHHDANLDVISNAVYGVNGGAIIAEAGNEIGVWKDNITINTTGKYVTFNSEHGNATDHPAARQQNHDDSFHQGIGFGFKSRLIETTDNVAVSSNGAGYSFWPMGKKGGSPSHIDPLASDYEKIYGYDPFFGQDDVSPSKIPNRAFANNEVLVAHVGFNTSADKRGSETDVSTVIEGFTAWEVGSGVVGFYQRDYLVKDSVFVGLQDGKNGGHVNTAAGNLSTSGVVAREFHELKLVNNHFENFDYGIWEESHERDQQFAHVILGNVYDDVVTKKRLYADGATKDNYLIHDDSKNWDKGIDVGKLNAKVNVAKSDLVMTKFYDRFSIVLEKTDSLGTMEIKMGSEKNRYQGASQKKWWGENAANNGYYEENGKYYLLVDAAVSDRLTGTVGYIEVAIELAFVSSAGDLPDGAKNLGKLPARLDKNGVGEFKIVDVREIGKIGNQLDAPDPDPVDPDPIDPDPVDPDPVDPDPVDPDPVDPDPVDPDPVDPDPVDPDPVDPPTPGNGDAVLKLDGTLDFNGSSSKVKNYEHTNEFSISSAEISFSFSADQVSSKAGLISKDALGVTGDGNHLSAWVEDGDLLVRFQNSDEQRKYVLKDIKAGQEYDLDISFGEGGIAVKVDGNVIGSDKNYDFSWSDSEEYLQVGSFGGGSKTGKDDFKYNFKGEISDLVIKQPSDSTDKARMEVGTENVVQKGPSQWHKVSFDEAIQNAVVVMGPISDENNQPAVARVRNVTSEGFEYQIDEWDYLDGKQIEVEISWIAGSEGTHEVGGTTVQFGQTVADGKRQQQVSLDDKAFGGKPIVLAQVASDNDDKAVVARAGGVFSDSFEFRLQNQESKAGQAHANEDVHWMAIDSGDNGSVFDTGFLDVNHVRTRVAGADADDAFLAAMQTFDGNDTAGLRYDEKGGRVRVQIEEEKSLDSEVWHLRERVGWVNVEDGVYELA
ncbi:G8 domain-containing protein [Actibacterium sp. 188UL27-1]|uniref:G8 domain-containing protein n=1 Tax=Actibacterium sp. 188UL27-1 TaxID=2786961 RepID=UPI00195B70D1|nr:G8 domain-containing protein [Actibacterium sp. 188UL27-1]MBM7069100.1 hypothetical protein [Actibacterium sp. 188UL27-1]